MGGSPTAQCLGESAAEVSPTASFLPSFPPGEAPRRLQPSRCAPKHSVPRSCCCQGLDASSGTAEAEEHPNQTGFPEQPVPRCESAGRKALEPFCAQGYGTDGRPGRQCGSWHAHPGSEHLGSCRSCSPEAAVAGISIGTLGEEQKPISPSFPKLRGTRSSPVPPSRSIKVWYHNEPTGRKLQDPGRSVQPTPTLL